MSPAAIALRHFSTATETNSREVKKCATNAKREAKPSQSKSYRARKAKLKTLRACCIPAMFAATINREIHYNLRKLPIF